MKKIYQQIEVVITNYDGQDVLVASGVAGDLDWLDAQENNLLKAEGGSK